MGMSILSMKEADINAFYMSFFMFGTTIFTLQEIGSQMPKGNCLATLPNMILVKGLSGSGLFGGTRKLLNKSVMTHFVWLITMRILFDEAQQLCYSFR
jgi:hypothetical protein